MGIIWGGNSSRVEVRPGKGWYVYAFIVILLGSCLGLCIVTYILTNMGSLS